LLQSSNKNTINKVLEAKNFLYTGRKSFLQKHKNCKKNYRKQLFVLYAYKSHLFLQTKILCFFSNFRFLFENTIINIIYNQILCIHMRGTEYRLCSLGTWKLFLSPKNGFFHIFGNIFRNIRFKKLSRWICAEWSILQFTFTSRQENLV